MTDELLRPFRDKLRGRPAAARGPETAPVAIESETPEDSIVIRGVRIGPFPEASPLHPGLVPGLPRVRLTLDLGARLRGDPRPFPPDGREALLRLCPRLLDHDCGAANELRGLFRNDADGPAGGRAPGAMDHRDGLAVAHLIEHVAIEIIVSVTGLARCSGVTCAHRDRFDRFDIFIECADPLAGRAAAILAVAIVRDLCLRHTERLALHRRCRDLLAALVSSGTASTVAEDAARRLGCGPDEALQTLEELVRLEYLSAVPTAYLFSSSSGVLFRRSADPTL